MTKIYATIEYLGPWPSRRIYIETDAGEQCVQALNEITQENPQIDENGRKYFIRDVSVQRVVQ